SNAFDSLMTKATADANGMSPNVSLTSASIDNPNCYASSGTAHGYLLQTATPASVGLPSYPLAAPLSIGS
ncbi:MAG: hypothetical protein RLN74_09260, partial [Ilumatobacter fluminis]